MRVGRSASVLVILLLGPASASTVVAQCKPDAFDGSFRLETGEVITGGYFVEEGVGSFTYLDTDGLEKAGLFGRIDDNVLQSVVPDDNIEITFLAEDDCRFDRLTWKERGEEPVRGERVYPHETRDVNFTSADGTELSGRVLLPRCSGPHPLVVYVHGSGPVDRHNGHYQTFLLQHGVGVLAYDKRGYTADPGAFRRPDMVSLAADAAAATRYAATVPGVDTDRIGLFGTSQGGWTAPPAAVEVDEVSFMILRAGAAGTEFEAHVHEKRQEFRESGLEGLSLDYAVDLLREIYGLAVKGEPLGATDRIVAPYLDEPWYHTAFGDGPISDRWSPAWWQWAQRNFPVSAIPYVERFDGPVLWFLGEKDENVPLVTTRAALDRAFDAAPGDDHEIVVIEDAPHSFLIPGPAGSLRYAEGFFNRVGAWLRERGLADPGCWDDRG